LFITAAVNSVVELCPPRSFVSTLPSFSTRFSAVPFEIHVVQQLHRAQQHRRWIRDVLADRLGVRVPCTLRRNASFGVTLARYRFKDDAFSTVTGSCDHSGTTNQPRGKIIHDVPVQIRHHHHVKLVRIGYHLHAARGNARKHRNVIREPRNT
ncbi:hypothetical protein X777_00877, partial [Ooceraea biroi]